MEKENLILRRRDNKTAIAHITCQEGGGKNTPNLLCCPFFDSEDLYATALIPFPPFFSFSKNYVGFPF